MNSALQNRLVGTLIIVALAVIFLPDLLDGKKQTQQDIQVNIPPAPPVLSMVTAKDIDVEQIAQQATAPSTMTTDSPIDDNDTVQASDTLDSASADLQQQTNAAKTSMQPATNKDSATASLANQTIKLETDPQDAVGWVVQLGSFRHQKNVRELLNKLDKAGYRTFSRPVNTPSGVLTKVFVGPEIDQSKLQDALPHLNEVTKLKGRLTPFTIK